MERHFVAGDIVQPLQGWLRFGWLTQGRNRRFQPWALMWNPVGILPCFVLRPSPFLRALCLTDRLAKCRSLSSPPAGERTKVRGRVTMVSLAWLKPPPHPACGHLLPHGGEGTGNCHPLGLAKARLGSTPLLIPQRKSAFICVPFSRFFPWPRRVGTARPDSFSLNGNLRIGG